MLFGSVIAADLAKMANLPTSFGCPACQGRYLLLEGGG
jgi:hypothetical protein